MLWNIEEEAEVDCVHANCTRDWTSHVTPKSAVIAHGLCPRCGALEGYAGDCSPHFARMIIQGGTTTSELA
jgi:hypothetical protein